jgi:prepilin-type N-terminal cleavage/methylation domain-containing protein
MSSRVGMTLIELIVALAITGVAIATGYQAYATIIDRRSSAAAYADSTARAFAVRETLASWLSNARLTIEEDEIVFRAVEGAKRRGAVERGSADLLFLTSARSPVSAHGTIVHLFVGSDSADNGLTAELSEWRGRRVARLRLDPAIAAMAVEFSSARGSRGEMTSSWVSSTVLPPTVRLRFAARVPDSLPALLRLPLTIHLDATRGVNRRGAF